MSEQACCAHLTVTWRTEQLPNGATRGWWECGSSCGARFVPVSQLAAVTAERDRAQAMLVDQARLAAVLAKTEAERDSEAGALDMANQNTNELMERYVAERTAHEATRRERDEARAYARNRETEIGGLRRERDAERARREAAEAEVERLRKCGEANDALAAEVRRLNARNDNLYAARNCLAAENAELRAKVCPGNETMRVTLGAGPVESLHEAAERVVRERTELRDLLHLGYDLVAEGIGGSPQYDHKVRARAFIRDAMATLSRAGEGAGQPGGESDGE